MTSFTLHLHQNSSGGTAFTTSREPPGLRNPTTDLLEEVFAGQSTRGPAPVCGDRICQLRVCWTTPNSPRVVTLDGCCILTSLISASSPRSALHRAVPCCSHPPPHGPRLPYSNQHPKAAQKQPPAYSTSASSPRCHELGTSPRIRSASIAPPQLPLPLGIAHCGPLGGALVLHLSLHLR